MNRINSKIILTCVDDYLKNQGCCPDDIEFFSGVNSIFDAVLNASKCLTKYGSIHPHQRRLKAESIAKASNILMACLDEIKKMNNFDRLFSYIDNKVGNITGIGELYVYDVSFRIGIYLGAYPNKVYLHRGTRVGAKNLGIAYDRRTLEMHELPFELQKLQPYQVEDILCIYKNKF